MEKEKKKKRMYVYYEVVMKARDRIVGGIPKSPEMIQGWIKANVNRADKVKQEELIKETIKAIGEEGVTEKMWTGFKTDPKYGLYVEGRQVKAMLKEGANVIKKVLDIPAFKSKLAERVWVHPDRIYLGMKEPSGTEERAVHVMTRLGPRSALKRFDYVEEAEITFELEVLNDGVITKPRLENVLEYCCKNGFGAMRSQGEGVMKFFTIKEIDKLSKNKPKLPK